MPEFAKKRWQIVPEKGIFQPLHNDKKSVLSIKESFSMGKKGPKFSQMLMVRLEGWPPPAPAPLTVRLTVNRTFFLTTSLRNILKICTPRNISSKSWKGTKYTTSTNQQYIDFVRKKRVAKYRISPLLITILIQYWILSLDPILPSPCSSLLINYLPPYWSNIVRNLPN